jgi:hypothetical protein
MQYGLHRCAWRISAQCEKQRETLIGGGARFYGLNIVDPGKPIPIAKDVTRKGSPSRPTHASPG